MTLPSEKAHANLIVVTSVWAEVDERGHGVAQGRNHRPSCTSSGTGGPAAPEGEGLPVEAQALSLRCTAENSAAGARRPCATSSLPSRSSTMSRRVDPVRGGSAIQLLDESDGAKLPAVHTTPATPCPCDGEFSAPSGAFGSNESPNIADAGALQGSRYRGPHGKSQKGPLPTRLKESSVRSTGTLCPGGVPPERPRETDVPFLPGRDDLEARGEGRSIRDFERDPDRCSGPLRHEPERRRPSATAHRPAVAQGGRASGLLRGGAGPRTRPACTALK